MTTNNDLACGLRPRPGGRRLFFRLQTFFYAFARLAGQWLARGFRELIRMLEGSVAEKRHLAAITTAPLAQDQVQTKANTFGNRQRSPEGLRL